MTTTAPRTLCRSTNAAAIAAASYAAIASAGGGATQTRAPGNAATAETTRRITSTSHVAYGATTPKVAALSGQTPICVAIVSASASRTRSGSSQRSNACCSGRAKSRIAATHENESANETVVTAAGQIAATTSAASTSAFHDAARAPQARASSATETITAARCDGRCAPLSHA